MQPAIQPSRARSLLLVLAILAAAFGGLSAAHLQPAAAAETLPLGSVTILGDSDPRCPVGASECHKFEIVCPGVASKILGWYSIRPATGTYRGTVLFFSGGGGTFYWAEEKRSAGFLIDRLIQDGFTVQQVRWGTAWEDASPGEVAGAHVACRPATIVDYLHDNEYAPPIPANAPGICGFCIAGPSGGSAQVAYTISHFGLDSKLDGVFPISGPTHAAVAKGCLPEREFADQYKYDGPSSRRIDGPLGYSASSGPFADTNGPCRLHDPAWMDELVALGVDTGGGDYVHPTTRVHLLMGQLDKILRAHAGDYVRRLGEGGPLPGDQDASPYVSYELVPNMPHGITEFNPGGGNTTLEDYPGLVRLRNDLLLTDTSKLTACNNGLDDDGDGTVDFAGGPPDPGCASAADASEQNHPGDGLVGPPCDNAMDDDGDGRIDHTDDDFGDPGCASPGDPSERVPFGTTNLWCDDGADNDGDGRVDFPDDPGCLSPLDNAPLPGDPPDPNVNPEKQPAGFGGPAVICDDGLDNDGDGTRDFLAGGGGDPDCASPGSPSEVPTVTISQPAEVNESGGQVPFTISIGSVPASTVTVSYATASGSAVSNIDFNQASGQVTFGPGDAGPKTVNVGIVDDTLDEIDRESLGRNPHPGLGARGRSGPGRPRAPSSTTTPCRRSRSRPPRRRPRATPARPRSGTRSRSRPPAAGTSLWGTPRPTERPWRRRTTPPRAGRWRSPRGRSAGPWTCWSTATRPLSRTRPSAWCSRTRSARPSAPGAPRGRS